MGAGPKDGGRLGVGGGDGQAPESAEGQNGGAAQFGGKARPGGEGHQLAAHRVDDAAAPQKGAESHKGGADPGGLGRQGEGPGLQGEQKGQYPQEFLPVLGAVKEGGEGGA